MTEAMTAARYFARALKALGLPASTPLTDAYQFGDDADKLAALVLAGKKTATASARDLYEPDEPLPHPGEYDVILDSTHHPVCVTYTDAVTVQPFLAVSADHAYREGEGDRSLAYWRQVHADFFKKAYAAEGRAFDPKTVRIVLEAFHVVYPIPNK
ncbi:hypothetical protein L248_2065 [Schleiferilactobacillus shenzhenensis LY-73]|uniref:ASCH domain-containing protein n=2 Tax=Schleiferilactobacillus shenzhenensis TaxID=1231337 RepID=U4TP41_9LACO|nr:hypothetical protein L248_2065 [Schleiferilactobacillus shenzhenensis LY-73]